MYARMHPMNVPQDFHLRSNKLKPEIVKFCFIRVILKILGKQENPKFIYTREINL